MKFTRDMDYSDKWHFANEDKSILIEPIDRGDGFLTLVIGFNNPYFSAAIDKRNNYIHAFVKFGVIKEFSEMSVTGFHLINLDKIKAANVFYKIIEAIESVSGKDSCIEIKKLFDELLPKYQPHTLFNISRSKVQNEIDSGNKKMEADAKRVLPLEIKERLTFTEDRTLKAFVRFTESIYEDSKEPRGLYSPMQYSIGYIDYIEKRDPSSKYLPIMKEMFKEKFKIDYEKAILTENASHSDAPKDKGGGTPGCSVM